MNLFAYIRHKRNSQTRAILSHRNFLVGICVFEILVQIICRWCIIISHSEIMHFQWLSSAARRSFYSSSSWSIWIHLGIQTLGVQFFFNSKRVKINNFHGEWQHSIRLTLTNFIVFTYTRLQHAFKIQNYKNYGFWKF